MRWAKMKDFVYLAFAAMAAHVGCVILLKIIFAGQPSEPPWELEALAVGSLTALALFSLIAIVFFMLMFIINGRKEYMAQVRELGIELDGKKMYVTQAPEQREFDLDHANIWVEAHSLPKPNPRNFAWDDWFDPTPQTVQLRARVAELEEALRWRPLEEGLPEDGETVEIINPMGRPRFFGYFVSGVAYDESGVAWEHATHWRPITARPLDE